MALIGDASPLLLLIRPDASLYACRQAGYCIDIRPDLEPGGSHRRTRVFILIESKAMIRDARLCMGRRQLLCLQSVTFGARDEAHAGNAHVQGGRLGKLQLGRIVYQSRNRKLDAAGIEGRTSHSHSTFGTPPSRTTTSRGVLPL